VIRYADQLCFNFNFKDSAVTQAQVELLCGEFSRALDELEEDLGTQKDTSGVT